MQDDWNIVNTFVGNLGLIHAPSLPKSRFCPNF
jgi:hypothetical protein